MKKRRKNDKAKHQFQDENASQELSMKVENRNAFSYAYVEDGAALDRYSKMPPNRLEWPLQECY